MDKEKLVKLILSITIAIAGIAGYLKGCQDCRQEVAKIAQEDIKDREDKAAKEVAKNRSKKTQLLENIDKKEDKYLSCMLSTNPLLQSCLQ